MESSGERILVSIEIERGVEPLTGTMSGADSPKRSFIGWTGLAAALTLILDEAGTARTGERPAAG
jgi:hypothetical protein